MAEKEGKNRIKKPGILSAVLTILLIAANAVFTAHAERCFQAPGDSPRVFLMKAAVYLVIFAVGTFAADRWVRLMKEKRSARFFRRKWYSVLALAVLFAAVYMVYLMVYWPGACGHDTCNQIKDLVTGMDPLPYNWINGNVTVSALMNDHHPVLTTLIFTGFYRLGLQLGSAETGMFLYCVVQIVIMSIAFSLFVCSMTHHGAPEILAAAAAVFYCMPFVAFYAISMIKDSLFSVVFFLWFLCYVGILESSRADTTREDRPGEAVSENEPAEPAVRKEPRAAVGRGRWVAFILLSVLSALTNKKGMYIAFLSGLCLIPFLRTWKERGKALLSAVVPALVIIVLLGKILFPIYRIYGGGTQEALGFAFQQTTYTYIHYPESFTDEDKEVLYQVIQVRPDEYETVYQGDFVDKIKERYNFYADGADLTAYLKLWLRQGLRHPGAYIRATLMVNGGFFVPGNPLIVYDETVWYDSIGGFAQPDERSGLRAEVTRFYDWLCGMPLTSIFFSNVLYLWWTPLLTLILVLRRGRARMTVGLIPVAANILFLLMGPICWTRYGLCQLFTVPVLWELPFVDD